MSKQMPTKDGLKKPVFALHGIRTFGKWRLTFADMANVCDPPLLLRQDDWHYGIVSALAFLCFWIRKQKLAWFCKKYDEEMEKSDIQNNLDKDEYPSIVAHSFGTYILGYSLLKYPSMKFDRVLLCGSILPEDFPWDQIVNRGQVKEVRNESANKDFWSGIVRFFVKGSGAAGKNGIKQSVISSAHGKVIDKPFPEYEHSDFFQKKHMSKYWLPFLQQRSKGSENDSGIFSYRSDNKPWGLYAIVIFIVIFTVLILVIAAASIISMIQTQNDSGAVLPPFLTNNGNAGNNVGVLPPDSIIEPTVENGGTQLDDNGDARERVQKAAKDRLDSIKTNIMRAASNVKMDSNGIEGEHQIWSTTGAATITAEPKFTVNVDMELHFTGQLKVNIPYASVKTDWRTRNNIGRVNHHFDEFKANEVKAEVTFNVTASKVEYVSYSITGLRQNNEANLFRKVFDRDFLPKIKASAKP